MLRLEGVRLQVGGFDLAADWSAQGGERLGVIGPSGAGKSSLLLAIAGFVPLAAGVISWSGQDLSKLPPGERPLTILFQDQNLFGHLTLTQNLALGLSPSLRLTPELVETTDAALARVGLAGFGARKPGELSGGQQGRAALARALLRARPMLLLDEPFAALGPALRAEMLELVKQVAQETKALVIMVSHDPRDVQRFAERTVLVADSTAHAPMETSALFANPPEALRSYLG